VTEALRTDIGFEPGPASNQDHPKVLSRVIVTPPGSPWAQARLARMDARHAAPLPLSDLVYQVRRLSSWRPASEGRFAVFYVRARDARSPFEAIETVDGRALKVAFGKAATNTASLQGLGLAVLLLALTGGLLTTAAIVGARARAESVDRLDAVERLAHAKIATAQTFRRGVTQARQLKAAVGRAAPASDVLNDLAWVATAKTPEARIVGLHWRDGVMALEVRGDPPPFGVIDRRLQRSAQQLRPGVWLWGVGAAGSAPPGKPGP